MIKYKEITRDVIEILKTFDGNINDLRIIEDDRFSSYLAIEHEQFGYMPLSIYGDGIKKVLAMAAAAARVKSGVLLIDEFETSIHSKAMRGVFQFLINLGNQRNIQLFLTTHSIEAVDELLACANGNIDDVKVITLAKKGEQTTARVVDGAKAEELRIYRNAELR
jgi:AAA15 family ATPase/GTPase